MTEQSTEKLNGVGSQDSNVVTEVPDWLVDRVALQIDAIGRKFTMAFALAIGKVIIDNFYEGDLSQWRKRGRRDASFRKLAIHHHNPLGESGLYRSVAIYELVRRLNINPRGPLSSTHLREVIPLPPEEQERLLREAEKEAWSTRKLRDEIERLCPPEHAVRGGRKRVKPAQRALRSVLRCLDESEVEPENENKANPSREEVAVALILRQVRATCSMVEERTAAKERPKKERSTELVPEPESEPDQSDSAAVPTARTRAKILITDDDCSLARALSRIVSQYGEPIVAGTVQEACDMLANIDESSLLAAIVDLKLPGAWGFELVAHLRRWFPNAYVTIFTGYLDADTVNLALDLQVDLVAKPLEPDRIHRLMKLATFNAGVVRVLPSIHSTQAEALITLQSAGS